MRLPGIRAAYRSEANLQSQIANAIRYIKLKHRLERVTPKFCEALIRFGIDSRCIPRRICGASVSVKEKTTCFHVLTPSNAASWQA